MNSHVQPYIAELEQTQKLLQKQIELLRERHDQLLQEQQRILEYQQELYNRQLHILRVGYAAHP